MTHFLRKALAVIMLALPLTILAQGTSQWREIHKVKRHETIFGIARKYDLTIQEIIDANPEMKEKGYELKKGTQIFIPYGKDQTLSANGAIGADGKPLAGTLRGKNGNIIKVGVMLPLLDHSSEGSRMIEYYRGVRAALDSLGRLGVKTEINLWNLNKDSLVDNVLRHNPSIAGLDVIFGPLYTTQVHALADFCRKNKVRLVIPFSTSANDVNSNPYIFQIYQDDENLAGQSIGAFIERFANKYRPIFINCNNPSDGKYQFTKTLRENLQARGISPELTSINSSIKDFAKHFSQSQPNVIILNTGAYRPLEHVFEKLDSLKKIEPSLDIATYGYNEWFIYQPNLEKKYFKYNVHIPTTYYFSRTSSRTTAFEKEYEAKYGQKMNPDCLPRMALMGFDHTMTIVLGLSKYGSSYVGDEKQNAGYKPLQNRLEFKRTGKGGYQNANFQIIRFHTDGTLDSLTY